LSRAALHFRDNEGMGEAVQFLPLGLVVKNNFPKFRPVGFSLFYRRRKERGEFFIYSAFVNNSAFISSAETTAAPRERRISVTKDFPTPTGPLTAINKIISP
jgi:hypothetical protein